MALETFWHYNCWSLFLLHAGEGRGCELHIWAFGTFLRGTLTLVWRFSGISPTTRTYHVSVQGLEPRTLCFPAQSPTDHHHCPGCHWSHLRQFHMLSQYLFFKNKEMSLLQNMNIYLVRKINSFKLKMEYLGIILLRIKKHNGMKLWIYPREMNNYERTEI